MHDTTAIDRHAIPPPPPRSDPPRDTEPDAGPWLCLAGEATVRADVAPRLSIVLHRGCLCSCSHDEIGCGCRLCTGYGEPVVSAVAGEP